MLSLSSYGLLSFCFVLFCFCFFFFFFLFVCLFGFFFGEVKIRSKDEKVGLPFYKLRAATVLLITRNA